MDAYFTVLRSIPRSISNCASLYDQWGLCNLQQLIFRRSPHLVKAICVRNMQSRHMQVYQLISGIKLISSFHLKKNIFFCCWCWTRCVPPMISQSVSQSQMQSMQIRYVSPFIGHHESKSNVELDCMRMARFSDCFLFGTK